VVSIEELTQMVPTYPDGRRARPRAVVRRLRSILEVVQRGPNGSLSRGSVFRILPPQQEQACIPPPEDEDTVQTDQDWLLSSIERMTGGKPP
jgi:hypothetical protein